MRLDDYLRRVGNRSFPRPPGRYRRGPPAARRASRGVSVRERVDSGGRRHQRGVDDIERKFLDEGQRRLLFRAQHAVRRGARGSRLAGDHAARSRPARPARAMVPHAHGAARHDRRRALAGRRRLRRAGAARADPAPRGRGGAPGGVHLFAAPRASGVGAVVRRRGLGNEAAEPIDLYEFSEDAQTPGDVEVANHYTSTHPDSIFRRSLTIQRTTRTDRTALRQGMLTQLSRWTGGGSGDRSGAAAHGRPRRIRRRAPARTVSVRERRGRPCNVRRPYTPWPYPGSSPAWLVARRAER